jgi:hypothetical protein
LNRASASAVVASAGRIHFKATRLFVRTFTPANTSAIPPRPMHRSI